jgi:FixJ family two-component response regulator
MIPKRQSAPDEPTVFVIDDDVALCDALANLFQSVGLRCVTSGSTKEFFRAKLPEAPCCLVLDVRLPGISGLDFQNDLEKSKPSLPIIFITGYADVPMSVQAMKRGAVEFLCKPFRDQELLDAVQLALERDRIRRMNWESRSKLQHVYETLTPREREVMALIVSGLMNKQVAGKLGLSEITVKVHRASIMRKMSARSFAELVRMADALKPSEPIQS